jgi:hypothetical protein
VSFGFGFALPHWKTLSGGFTPASLFTGGEQGCWYDPSDYGPNGTLFQDSAGTTPVTAVEQFVGLMLDKSKGLVLGSELITGAFVNGGILPWPNFSASGTGFTASVSGVFGIYQVVNPNGISIVSGKWYKVFVNVTQSTDDVVTVSLQSLSTGGGTARSTSFTFGPASATTITGYLQATSTTTAYLQFSQQGTTITFDVASVSVRELPGNHAFQTTSAKRPKLAARYNLLTYSEEFDNGAWTKSNVTVTANAVVAPDGTTTADALFETATNSDHGARTAAGVTTASGVSYKLSFRVKSNGRNYVLIYINAPASGRYFDVTPSTAGAVLGNYTGTNLPATITALADNWFLCEVTFTASTTSVLCETYISSAGNNLTYDGDITKGIYIWGADLRTADQATGLIGPTYQRVAAATVYDTAGFLPYLAFDGLSWSMSTNSIDFSAGDKMTVWAGVRKLSDAAQGTLYELSSDESSNNGTFAAWAPWSASLEYSIRSRADAAAISAQRASADSAVYAAPVTNVLTALHDISGDLTVLRLNAAQVSSSTSDQGTGNFGNYPLYIGARNNASNFFTGWLTSLIVRGAQSTQSQIEATEAWVNGKTGAY